MSGEYKICRIENTSNKDKINWEENKLALEKTVLPELFESLSSTKVNPKCSQSNSEINYTETSPTLGAIKQALINLR